MDDLDLALRSLREATESIEPSSEAMAQLHSAVDAAAVSLVAAHLATPAVKAGATIASKLLRLLLSLTLGGAIVGGALLSRTHSNEPELLDNMSERFDQIRRLQPMVNGYVVINGKYVRCEPSDLQVRQVLNEKLPAFLRDSSDAGRSLTVEKTKVRTKAADGGHLPSCDSLLNASPARR